MIAKSSKTFLDVCFFMLFFAAPHLFLPSKSHLPDLRLGDFSYRVKLAVKLDTIYGLLLGRLFAFRLQMFIFVATVGGNKAALSSYHSCTLAFVPRGTLFSSLWAA